MDPEVAVNAGQAMWDEMSAEREAGSPPSTTQESKTTEALNPGEVTPSTPAAPEALSDPFEGLSPAVRERMQEVDRLREAVAVIPHMQQALKSAEGRVAAMQRESDAAKAAARAVADAPSIAQISAAKGDVQKWEALRDDFPDWAEATEQFVRAELAGLQSSQTAGLSTAQVDQLVNERVELARTEMLRDIETSKVEDRHSGWLGTVGSAEFSAWHALQPDSVKALSASTQGRDAIKLLDLYHATGKTTATQVQGQRTNRLAAAVTTRTGTAAPTGKPVDAMSPAELWAHEAKRGASRTGRGLIY